jgi:hypothetical protein
MLTNSARFAASSFLSSTPDHRGKEKRDGFEFSGGRNRDGGRVGSDLNFPRLWPATGLAVGFTVELFPMTPRIARPVVGYHSLYHCTGASRAVHGF